MSKVKILVVEDEIIIADNICDILEDLGYEALEPAVSYNEAVERLEEERPDLVLLDINIIGMRDGIDLAWKIRDDYDIPFIFLTSNADSATVERAKKVNPPAYLLKPFNKSDLFTSIEIALFNYTKVASPTPKSEPDEEQHEVVLKDILFVKHKQTFYKVKFTDILYFNSEHVYVKIMTKDDQEYLVRSSLTKLTKRLPNYFFKIHRSYIVNLHHIDAVGNINIKLGKYELPFGKGYRTELLKKIDIINHGNND